MFAIAKGLLTGLAAFLLAGTAAAQENPGETGLEETGLEETRLGEDGFESPAATLNQVDWLIGQWVGEGIQGAPAMESWLPPTGTTMVGTFVQQTGEGTIMFTEHLYLMEEEGTLVLRLKHFNADLTGWEERQDMLTFRLVAIEECAAYFNALTLRCADADRPGEGLVAAVRMQSGGEQVFRFDPVESAQNTACSEAMTTIDMNACYAALLEQAKERSARYFDAALESVMANSNQVAQTYAVSEPATQIADQLRASQTVFDAYVEAECGAVLAAYEAGTSRNAMYLICQIERIDERTHTLWQNWLVFMDSTPPILPEPGPTL